MLNKVYWRPGVLLHIYRLIPISLLNSQAHLSCCLLVTRSFQASRDLFFRNSISILSKCPDQCCLNHSVKGWKEILESLQLYFPALMELEQKWSGRHAHGQCTPPAWCEAPLGRSATAAAHLRHCIWIIKLGIGVTSPESFWVPVCAHNHSSGIKNDH